MGTHSKKAFITGLSGFTGVHLSNHLSNHKWEVCGLGLHESPSILNAKLEEKDKIVEFLQHQKPTHIFHLAGISYVGHQNQEAFYKVNTVGTQILLDAIVDAKIQVDKVILASSATIYGNQDFFVLSEDMTPNPNNHYAISKLAMEYIARTYFDKLPIIVTRPFNYTGIGHSEDFIIPKIAKHFREKKLSITLGNINTFREFNDVEWVCDIYRKLAICDSSLEIVNIASGKTISVSKVIEIFQNLTSHFIKIEIDNNLIRKNDIYELKGDNDKLKSMINYIEGDNFEENIKKYLGI